MRRYPHLLLALLLCLVLAVASWQGSRVKFLRESDLFYRWVLAAATQTSLLWELSETQQNEAGKPMMDRALYESVEKAIEPLLPEATAQADDANSDGSMPSKLVLLVRHGQASREIWDAVRSDNLAQVRADFLTYRREHRLSSSGTQFDLVGMYAANSTMVNLSNLFFGFRKMAANLVWLEVDKYWHAGMLHRMVPMMNLCVTLDPNFVDAFLLGAWHLAYNITANLTDTPEIQRVYEPRFDAWVGEKERFYYWAVEFLKDGIRKNPRDYRLYFDLGFEIYTEKLKDHANAVLYLSQAVRCDYGDAVWVPRQLNIALQNNGQYEEAIRGWQQYLERAPQNPVGPRFIMYCEGLILEREARRLAEESYQAQAQVAKAREEANAASAAVETARANNDPAALSTAEAKLAEANQALERLQAQQKAAQDAANAKNDEAAAKWQAILDSQGGDDAFAQAHKERIDAMKLLEKGDYYEALAVLDHARWAYSQLFDEISNQIIDVKQRYRVPLNASEKMELERQQETARLRAARQAEQAQQQDAPR